ncbi:PQQ-dependent sugar dehydrogenase [Solirubrobacter sp. CPCC 204708]|uniref:PQQ-dependent sugar dehydrogenase n=1 Tax=Solirubrobacter deserti TaxID=2282478 RepID=A0ABT4RM66_9ACTN|nr:PQQ-dependent sugar dehydrogenase [Solirubrobacter deserti]MBE2317955.1 PQQ-dependent sugar dehydrogenase [Solirubrobacter deserti]MDA0139634.1 PQQ-dependent sugar dehydrogenase [Solirubrobacter deserti]
MKKLAPAVAALALLPASASAQTPVTGAINEPAPRPATPERIATLQVAAGFKLSVAAQNLGNARMLAVGRDGTVFVTRREEGDVLALRDRDGDGAYERRRTATRGLKLVHGITLRGNRVYLVTDTKLYRARVDGDRFTQRRLLTADLPDAGQHPNRTLAFGPDQQLYITVGSTCNACDDSNPQSATILRARADGTHRRVFASGLRNTIGFGWHPQTEQLWGMDHGSDWRGDDQPPEELNRIVRGGNYGWPFCFGARAVDRYLPADPPSGTPESYCARTAPPTLTYQAHSAPIGMAFTGDGNAFIAMRGSWNRGAPVGYKLVRLNFSGGQPTGFEDIVSGFLTEGGQAQFGRLAGVTVDRDGSVLFSDDSNGVLYRLSRS